MRSKKANKIKTNNPEGSMKRKKMVALGKEQLGHMTGVGAVHGCPD